MPSQMMPSSFEMSRSSARWPRHLGADLVDVLERRARELELAARLERDRGARAQERDERAARRLALGVPAVAVDERLEHGEHAALALVGERRAGRGVDAELLGLGADAVLLRRLHRLVEGDEELVERGDGLRPWVGSVRRAWVGHRWALRVGGAATRVSAGARSLTSFDARRGILNGARPERLPLVAAEQHGERGEVALGRARPAADDAHARVEEALRARRAQLVRPSRRRPAAGARSRSGARLPRTRRGGGRPSRAPTSTLGTSKRTTCAPSSKARRAQSSRGLAVDGEAAVVERRRRAQVGSWVMAPLTTAARRATRTSDAVARASAGGRRSRGRG